MADDKKTLKFQMMMSPREAELLDDWMFKHRLRSRAEAIRRLCQVALRVESYREEIGQTMQRMQDYLPFIWRASEDGADPKDTRTALAYLLHETWDTFSIWDQLWMASEIWRDADRADFEAMGMEVDKIIRRLRSEDEDPEAAD